jgi:hypothetical protein
MRPLVAHCHLGLGKLHRATPEAAEHLAAAGTLYRDLGMRYFAMQAAAALRELG